MGADEVSGSTHPVCGASYSRPWASRLIGRGRSSFPEPFHRCSQWTRPRGGRGTPTGAAVPYGARRISEGVLRAPRPTRFDGQPHPTSSNGRCPIALSTAASSPYPARAILSSSMRFPCGGELSVYGLDTLRDGFDSTPNRARGDSRLSRESRRTSSPATETPPTRPSSTSSRTPKGRRYPSGSGGPRSKPSTALAREPLRSLVGRRTSLRYLPAVRAQTKPYVDRLTEQGLERRFRIPNC